MAENVYAAKCKACGRLAYPTHFTCPACGGVKHEAVPVTGEGKILTWTRAFALPLDYADLYLTLGIVEMDMGIRVTARLDIDDPKIGARVRAGIGKVRETNGKEITGLVFTAT
jgi:uncharacterized protein